MQCIGSEADVVRLNYGDQTGRPIGGVILTRHGSGGGAVPFSFYAAALGQHGAIQSEPQNDYSHPFGMLRIVEKMRDMVMTGTSPIGIADILENIAVADAIRQSAAMNGKDTAVETIC